MFTFKLQNLQQINWVRHNSKSSSKNRTPAKHTIVRDKVPSYFILCDSFGTTTIYPGTCLLCLNAILLTCETKISEQQQSIFILQKFSNFLFQILNQTGLVRMEDDDELSNSMDSTAGTGKGTGWASCMCQCQHHPLLTCNSAVVSQPLAATQSRQQHRSSASRLLTLLKSIKFQVPFHHFFKKNEKMRSRHPLLCYKKEVYTAF